MRPPIHERVGLTEESPREPAGEAGASVEGQGQLRIDAIAGDFFVLDQSGDVLDPDALDRMDRLVGFAHRVLQGVLDGGSSEMISITFAVDMI